MWSFSAALSFHGLRTLLRRSIRRPPPGGLAVRHPRAKDKTAAEDSDARENGIEQIKGPHGTDADEVEQGAFDAQVGERLMQAFEDPIRPMHLCFVWHKSLASRSVSSEKGRRSPGTALYAPEPTQDIHGENGNPGSGGSAGQRLLGTGFAVGEAVTADHDCHQACHLGNGPGKQGLDGGEAGVER